MYDGRNFFYLKRYYLFGLILILFITVIYLAFLSEDRGDYNISKREVLLRRIGHEILLQSGDSTSRVLPIKKIAENEYQIRFANAITFQPDSLIGTTRRFLGNAPGASNYIVNVINGRDSSITYGYAISKNRKDDIVTCQGRRQPSGNYMINIKFKPSEIAIEKNGYLLGSLSFLAFIGFIVLKSVKPRKGLIDGQNTTIFTLGSVMFDVTNRKLFIDGKTIPLTGTETRVLLIFASSPNEIIERSRLQKEIWEDDGVIVGRSLDMFISKLRKKLEYDPNINIVVVRSKGYKLEVSI